MTNNEKLTPIIVGIMGGSASGKTTFAAALTEKLADLTPITLNQDSYFRDWSEFTPEEREKVITANHPDAVQWDVLIADVEKLRSNSPIETPAPGTRAASRGDEKKVTQPSSVVIVEGHLIYWNEQLRNLIDIKLFLDVDAHERVLRRMLRDVGTRSANLESAISWYRRDVLPNFPIYTEPCKQYADMIIPYLNENHIALQTIVAGIRAQLTPHNS
ncbi:uridine kinase [Candidatus Poribacteria bacterium]|nr:uridine kinase [Candidatus Poribacteria bacterium]